VLTKIRSKVRPGLLLICGAAIAVVALAVGGDGGHGYTLTFESAGQLVKGDEVKIGGHPVGSVDAIDLTDDGLAAVDVSVEQELHEGTSAVIRQTSLAGIANRYVSISPGPDSAPSLPGGATLGPEFTEPPVDFDQVFNAFTPRARRGLARFIEGQAGVYAGRGPEANRTYEYLEPALAQWNGVLDELNADERLLGRFISSSARLFDTVASRGAELSSSVTSARTAFEAIASENTAFDRALVDLAPTFRRSNTTFVNLRAALDDLDPLVETAKPATKDLAPFLRELRPVLSGSRPLLRDLSVALDRPGAANDLGELVDVLPRLAERAGPSLGHGREAIADFQPIADFARPYAPEMLNALARLGQVTGYYDAAGHFARVGVADLNLFAFDEGTGQLDPIPPAAQYDPLGPPQTFRRCPGGATQPAPDSSNPFVDPPWPMSGLDSSDCDPAAVPPGP
jgi:phospholipid/cholesterol/gamma-HCH transport system substrate-binding protein